MSSTLPPSPIPFFNKAATFREWREKAFSERQSVGYVPTMGALHEGHLSLVRRSLTENDLTVVSIFVNPTQFAPHEDLSTYPRTLPQDVAALLHLSFSVDLAPNNDVDASSTTRKVSAIFLPDSKEMYPSGITQDVSAQKGTFVEVKGYSHQMEGRSRPTFFRGVTTVVTKLFNVIQPTRAYFGQKDIQQALLLKRMTRDLLISHPLPENLHIMPTARDPVHGTALSSRNAYLTPDQRQVAPTLYKALSAAKIAWETGFPKVECLARAHAVVGTRMREARENGLKVDIRLDFIEINDADTFDIIEDDVTRKDLDVALLNGALFVGKTRLIDNLILGNDASIIGYWMVHVADISFVNKNQLIWVRGGRLYVPPFFCFHSQQMCPEDDQIKARYFFDAHREMMDKRLDVRVRLSADRPSSLTAAPKTKSEGS